MIQFELPDDIVRKIAIESFIEEMDDSAEAFMKLFIDKELLISTSENSDSECDSDSEE
jgi:hypothetical protein